MASQAARSWAPPAAALPPALLALALARDAVPAAAVVLLLGHLLALAGAAWQAHRGLLPAPAAVGGFTAGLVLAVPGATVLAGVLGDAAVVVAGLLALATAGGCAALAARLVPAPSLEPPL